MPSVSITANGVSWTEGVQYTYDSSTGLCEVSDNAFLLAAATFSVDNLGFFHTNPSSIVISVTGTPSGYSAPQSAVSVVSAYSDGTEAFSSVTKIRNNFFRLAMGGGFVPKYYISTNSNDTLTLLPSSHPAFGFTENILSVDTTLVDSSATAYINADYPNGSFVIQLIYDNA